MQQTIKNLEQSLIADLSVATDAKSVEIVKNTYSGRKGKIAELFSQLGKVPAESKKEVGALLNGLKTKAETLIKEKEASFQDQKQTTKTDAFDVTLPGKRINKGHLSILTQVMNDLISVFSSMGYVIAQGPEIESDYYNFEALNIPADHPSKDMWSTFYVGDHKLLRTHTSPVQVRFMEKNKPPFAAIFPGKVYRRDGADATHLPVFHQLEGLAVGEKITMSDLKGTLTEFLRRIFGTKRKVRFRPSYFPFTEPSAEVDVECFVCSGMGCRLCKNTGWLEILGSGMVDPNVFKSVNYDTEKVSGFAFGMGIERIAMLKYGIDDIRLFFENDLRFIKQF